MPTRWLNCATFVFDYRYDNQAIQNSIAINLPSGWNATQLEAMASALEAWWTAELQPHLPNSIELHQIIATDQTALTSARVAHPVSQFGGTAAPAGTICPANVTCAIHFNTGDRGRGRSGRNYFPILMEAQVDNDYLDAAMAAIIEAAYAALQAAITAAIADAIWVVLHRIAGGEQLAAGTWSPVLGAGFRDFVIDSQRDRLPFHKKHKKKKTVPVPP